MHVVMIDNYDSFIYNIVQYLQVLGCKVETFRNDQISALEVINKNPKFIVLSPGPSVPKNAGICLELIKLAVKFEIPLLGVCLGHQAIAEVFGGKLEQMSPPLHGKTSLIHHHEGGAFKGRKSPLKATRYHSLIVEEKSLPKCLHKTAWTKSGEIMGLKHQEHHIEGVQFHPESVLSEYGSEIFQGFMDQIK